MDTEKDKKQKERDVKITFFATESERRAWKLYALNHDTTMQKTIRLAMFRFMKAEEEAERESTKN
jgi:hypothetical protein